MKLADGPIWDPDLRAWLTPDQSETVKLNKEIATALVRSANVLDLTLIAERVVAK